MTDSCKSWPSLLSTWCLAKFISIIFATPLHILIAYLLKALVVYVIFRSNGAATRCMKEKERNNFKQVYELLFY